MIGQEIQSCTTLMPLRRNCERRRELAWGVWCRWIGDARGAAAWVGLCGCSLLEGHAWTGKPVPYREFDLMQRQGNSIPRRDEGIHLHVDDEGIRFGLSKSAGGTGRGVG